MSSLRNGLRPDRPEFCFRPVVCAAEGRAQRALGGQACAYEAPGMAHGDVDMSDVHGDSAAADNEPWPAALSPSQGHVVFTINNQHESPRATAAARPIPTLSAIRTACGRRPPWNTPPAPAASCRAVPSGS